MNANAVCSAQSLQGINTSLLGSLTLRCGRWFSARARFAGGYGSPCPVILGQADLALLQRASAVGINTNFGTMTGAWLELQMPELGLTAPILGYGSDTVWQAVQVDSQDFAGLVGLPALRMLKYGGDDIAFWVRQRSGVP